MTLFEQLKAEGRRIGLVDFDGVIAHYEGWKGHDIFCDPRPDYEMLWIEVVRERKALGDYIVIFTCRPDTPTLP